MKALGLAWAFVNKHSLAKISLESFNFGYSGLGLTQMGLGFAQIGLNVSTIFSFNL